jgi:transglutaminase-like putative cysteine protease
MQYEEAVSEYLWVKENIRYAFSRWDDAATTLAKKSGHCGMKAELLVSRLKARGIEARYVEGRPSRGDLPITKIISFSVHFWVEASIDGKWLTLDPTPDRGIVYLLGDTEPGTHLESPEYITRWDEIPSWYKKGYNHPLIAPFRWISNIKLICQRKTGNHKNQRGRELELPKNQI